MRGEFSVFREELLQWFQNNKRALPWRDNPTLYKTIVSEFMLQQTQVETVMPHFHRWKKQFPDFATLANASEQEVIKQWEGLGYYTRARNLRKLAVSLLQNGIPQSYQEWLERPGIGPYTAAAICSIAQDIPEPVIDGNVIRVLYRVTNDGSVVRSTTEARKKLLPLAKQLIDPEQPGNFNEAMMELGATICRKNKPACLLCPIRNHCEAYDAGTETTIPVISRPNSRHVMKSRLWLINNECLLLHVYPDNAKRLSGLAELPEIHARLEELPVLVRKRGISNEVITESVFHLDMHHPEAIRCAREPHAKWIPVTEIDSVSLSGPHRRWVNEILEIK